MGGRSRSRLSSSPWMARPRFKHRTRANALCAIRQYFAQVRLDCGGCPEGDEFAVPVGCIDKSSELPSSRWEMRKIACPQNPPGLVLELFLPPLRAAKRGRCQPLYQKRAALKTVSIT